MSELRGRLAREVRRHRDKHAQSLEEFSRQIGLSERRLRQLEKGETDPKLSTLEAMADALGYVSVAELLGGRRPRPPGWLRVETSEVVAGALGEGEDDLVKRRQFLAGLGATAALAAVSDPDRLASILEKGAAAIDRQVVEQLAQATRMFEQQANQLGHRALLHLVQAHGAHVEELLAGSMAAKLRARLLSVAGETAVLEATLLWYIGNHRAVGSRLQAGLTMAEAANDRPLGAFALGRLALHGLKPADRVRVLDEGGFGFRPRDASPVTRAWLAWIQADAASLLGNGPLAERHYERVRDIFATGPTDDERSRPVVPLYLPTDIPGDWGGILVRLGRAQEARQELDTALKDLDGQNLKQRGWLLFAKASAYANAANPEPDEAAKTAVEALGVANSLGAEPMISALRDVDSALQPWANRPPVAELHHLLAGP